MNWKPGDSVLYVGPREPLKGYAYSVKLVFPQKIEIENVEGMSAFVLPEELIRWPEPGRIEYVPPQAIRRPPLELRTLVALKKAGFTLDEIVSLSKEDLI